MAVTKLPLYPGARAREALSPSHQATLNSAIAGTLQQILELPKEKRDVSSSVAFVASYAKDHAQRTLHALIWDTHSDSSGKPKPHRYTSKFSTTERNIHERTLKLSQILANDLPLEALIDLAVVYDLTNPKRFRTVLLSVSNNAQLIKAIATEAAPAFTTILSSNAQGLYGLRKASYILLSFLHTAPPELVRPFARDREFVLSIGKAYDTGLTACARSYGGIRPERITSQSTSTPPLDDWEKIFLETKVALIDSFHILIRILLKDVEELKDAGPALAARCEAAFEVVFGLQDLPSSSLSSDTVPVPFLDQSLLADYQHTYGLSRIIAEVTRRADDPRTELLESTLQSLDQGGVQESDRPGALKLLLRSSGAQPGIDNLGNGKATSVSHQGGMDVKGKGKGKGKAAAPALVVEDSKIDAAITQVLDIFPEQDPDYLRFLLVHQDYPYKGDAERLIGALLEGTAPSVDEVHGLMESGGHAAEESAVARVGEVDGKDEFAFTRERRNVFDEEAMDVSQLRVGKKKDDAQTVLQDRAYIEQMKADILRRAEEISDEEEDEDEGNGAKGKGIIVAFEDELDEGGLKVRDGEESSDGGSDDEEDDHDGEDAQPKTPETILELAYIADPKVFDRDVQTRRSKARQDLRIQTGWADEQIEGWRIMLERNPNKDKILQKHEFTGNRRGAILPPTGAPSHHPPGRGRGQGRGRGGGGGGGGGGGRGRGRGRGRGGRGGGDGGEGGGGDSTARDRAYKDKNKARHANHNRKSGHDKKLARVAGPS